MRSHAAPGAGSLALVHQGLASQLQHLDLGGLHQASGLTQPVLGALTAVPQLRGAAVQLGLSWRTSALDSGDLLIWVPATQRPAPSWTQPPGLFWLVIPSSSCCSTALPSGALMRAACTIGPSAVTSRHADA